MAIRGMILSISIVLSLSSASGAFAETRLDAGDVVEIAVVGVPELRQRATVSPDGELALPLIGELKVIGMQLPELRTRVRELLSNKAYRQRTADGRENVIAIWPDEISIDVVEYRPIYLNGDVSRPGEQKHRPGMTVRQAVALAGGYDIMRFRMANPIMESADLRSEYEALWTEFARDRAYINRLKNELGEKSDADADLSQVPIAPSVLSEIVKLQADQLSAREATVQKEKAHIQHSIELTDTQLNVLTDQQQRTLEQTKADMSELETATALQKKGMVLMSRVLEARRSLLWSSSAFLQGITQVAQFRRDNEELKRKLETVDDQRRIDVLRDLETATMKIATTRARLQAVGEKLLYSTAIRTQLARAKGSKPEIVIVRKNENGPNQFVADEDAVLLPGDTVEVSLRSEYMPGLLSQEDHHEPEARAALTGAGHTEFLKEK